MSIVFSEARREKFSVHYQDRSEASQASEGRKFKPDRGLTARRRPSYNEGIAAGLRLTRAVQPSRGAT